MVDFTQSTQVLSVLTRRLACIQDFNIDSEIGSIFLLNTERLALLKMKAFIKEELRSCQ